MSTIPRLVISAPSSGHGKTAVSVGLLSALTARGYRAAGFKIGPDHVDAAYLGLAAGRPGRNLDPRMIGAKRIGPVFAHGAGSLDIAVVEGTMGLFDGLAGRTDSESTAQISGLLRAPVVLVVDVGAMGQSVAALVHGFRAYDELLWLGGVILNRVASSRHEQLLREALDDIGVPVLGALRRHALTDIGDAGAPLPSRHHGVAPVVHHNLDAVRAVRRLGEVIAGAVDIDRAMALARSAPRLTSDPWSAAEEVAAARAGEPAMARIGRRPIIGVAFSYPETAELLTAAGAEVVPFDPLRDEFLPESIDGLVVGGALPESYAEELGFNTRLRAAVAAHAAAGRPIAAEGTGLVWLCRDFNGRPMCGVVDASARETDLVVLGYREATARSSSVLLPVGAQVVGHKMHRTTISPRAGLQAAWTWAGGPAEGFVHRGVHASYLGLHWAGTPSIASRFVAAAGAAAPVQGQWTTPSTHPYGRPSVVPAAQAPSGSGSTLQLPAAASPPSAVPTTGAGVEAAAGAAAFAGAGPSGVAFTKTTVPPGLTMPEPARSPAGPAVPGPSPVSAPAGFSGAVPATSGASPVSAPAGTVPAASPVSVPGPVSAPGGFGGPAPSTYSSPAPVVGAAGSGVTAQGSPPSAYSSPAPPTYSSPAPVSAPSGGTGGGEAPTVVIRTAAGSAASLAPPVQALDGAGEADEVDGIASSPFGPTSRAGVALASASQAAESGGRAGGSETAVVTGIGPSTTTDGASVGVPSTPNPPATASGLPSSGVVPTTVSAPPASVQSPTSPGAVTSAATAPATTSPGAAAPAGTAGARTAAPAGAGIAGSAGPVSGAAAGALSTAGPVSGAGAVGSLPLDGSGVQPVSTPPLRVQSGHQWSGVPATSSAVPVSSAPMPTVAAPVSAAPAGMTVISAAGSDLVAPDEAPTAYLQIPAQVPLGAGDHSPVSAPPDSGPVPVGRRGDAGAARDAGAAGEGPPTSGPPAGGATEAA